MTGTILAKPSRLHSPESYLSHCPAVPQSGHRLKFVQNHHQTYTRSPFLAYENRSCQPRCSPTPENLSSHLAAESRHQFALPQLCTSCRIIMTIMRVDIGSEPHQTPITRSSKPLVQASILANSGKTQLLLPRRADIGWHLRSYDLDRRITMNTMTI